eukprot:6232272-Amphidinium_carterae.1
MYVCTEAKQACHPKTVLQPPAKVSKLTSTSKRSAHQTAKNNTVLTQLSDAVRFVLWSVGHRHCKNTSGLDVLVVGI